MKMKKSKYIALASVLLMLAVAGAACVAADDADATTDDIGIVEHTNLPSGTVNVAYSTTLQRTSTDITLLGTLPAGLSISSSNVLSGTPTAAGTYTFDTSESDVATNEVYHVTYTITINAQAVDYVTSVSVSSSTAAIYIGDTLTLTGSVTPSAGVYTELSWYVVGYSVAKITSQTATSCTVTGLSAGTATVRYYCEANNTTYHADCAVTVSPHQCVVTYDANNASATGTMASQTFVQGTAQTLRANAFALDGSTFAGWSLTATGAVKYTDMQTVDLGAVADALTLYSVWTANGSSDVVPSASFEYIKTGMTVVFTDQSTSASTWSWSFGDTLTSVSQSPEHTFSKSGDYTVTLTVTSATGTTATTSQIVTVGGDPDTTYTVAYDAAGGSTVESVKTTGGSSITLPSCTYAGHTFVGWFIGDTQAGVAGAKYQVAGDVTLTAHWADGTVTTFTVSFYLVADGKSTLDCSQTVISGGKATYYLPSTVGEGYNGWYTSSDFKAKYSFSTPVTTDLSLYCKVTHISPTPEWATIVGYICAVLGAICAVAAIAVMPLLGIPAVVLLALAGYLIWL